MAESYEQLIKRLSASLPRFNDGRINYSGSRESPVVNCGLYAEGKVLLVKRSQDVLAYPGKWNGISGFIDTFESVEVIARREIQQETGLGDQDITGFIERKPYAIDDQLMQRIWHVFPVRVELKAVQDITLNHEHTDFVWVDPSEVETYDILPDFKKVLEKTIDP